MNKRRKCILTERPACDWLTLTSFDEAEEARMLSAFWEMSRIARVSPEGDRQAQYKGVSFDGAFIGVGELADKWGELKKGVMFRAWGSTAQEAIESLQENPIKRCTRIDLQITIPQPYDYRARNLKDKLENAAWFGRKRKPVLYEDGGLDTVYVGSRTSDRIIRIYVKEVNGLYYLRFEVEYHKDRATSTYLKCSQGNQHTMGGILRAELEQLPEVDCVGMVALRKALDFCAVTIAPPERIQQPNSKLAWLHDSVDPVIRRLANDHDDGQEVRKLVARWHRYIQDIDKSSTP